MPLARRLRGSFQPLQPGTDRYMDGVAPPPEHEAERVIVRITPEKLYHWPPVPAES
jgi:hypothetical protein